MFSILSTASRFLSLLFLVNAKLEAIDSAQNDHANVVHAMLANKEAGFATFLSFRGGLANFLLGCGSLGEAHIEKIRSLFSQLGAEKTGVITYAMCHSTDS